MPKNQLTKDEIKIRILKLKDNLHKEVLNNMVINLYDGYEDFEDEGYTEQKAKYRRGTFSESDSEEDDC
jgi:hypothetical protein